MLAGLRWRSACRTSLGLATALRISFDGPADLMEVPWLCVPDLRRVCPYREVAFCASEVLIGMPQAKLDRRHRKLALFVNC